MVHLLPLTACRFILENWVIDRWVRNILTVYPVVIVALVGNVWKHFNAEDPTANAVFTGRLATSHRPETPVARFPVAAGAGGVPFPRHTFSFSHCFCKKPLHSFFILFHLNPFREPEPRFFSDRSRAAPCTPYATVCHVIHVSDSRLDCCWFQRTAVTASCHPHSHPAQSTLSWDGCGWDWHWWTGRRKWSLNRNPTNYCLKWKLEKQSSINQFISGPLAPGKHNLVLLMIIFIHLKF